MIVQKEEADQHGRDQAADPCDAAVNIKAFCHDPVKCDVDTTSVNTLIPLIRITEPEYRDKRTVIFDAEHEPKSLIR